MTQFGSDKLSKTINSYEDISFTFVGTTKGTTKIQLNDIVRLSRTKKVALTLSW